MWAHAVLNVKDSMAKAAEFSGCGKGVRDDAVAGGKGTKGADATPADMKHRRPKRKPKEAKGKGSGKGKGKKKKVKVTEAEAKARAKVEAKAKAKADAITADFM
jgi:hypothetical protein